MKVINARPIFLEVPKVEFDVVVTRNQNNTLVEPKYFKYTSPLLKDDENMALSIKLIGFEELKFVSFPPQDMNQTFQLLVDRSMVTESGSWDGMVVYGDEF